MITITARNINQAFPKGIGIIRTCGVELLSRNGPTLDCGLVTNVYLAPTERVLFCAERDANPFFHLFESLWMLAGRNDIDFIASILPRMRDFSDDGKRFHGAYGFRWREHFGEDQLEACIALLRRDPNTRRAVVAMWDPAHDLVEGSKDLPCNTTIYFKIRHRELDMTVCNRSNDAIWGTYGANVVHLSMLQEYVAAKAGLPVGSYTQISDSFHAYTTGEGGKIWNKVRDVFGADDFYNSGEVESQSLGAADPNWDMDLERFFSAWDRGTAKSVVKEQYKTDWWNGVALPMWCAFYTRDLADVERVTATDWKLAARRWIERRKK